MTQIVRELSPPSSVVNGDGGSIGPELLGGGRGSIAPSARTCKDFIEDLPDRGLLALFIEAFTHGSPSPLLEGNFPTG